VARRAPRPDGLCRQVSAAIRRTACAAGSGGSRFWQHDGLWGRLVLGACRRKISSSPSPSPSLSPSPCLVPVFWPELRERTGNTGSGWGSGSWFVLFSDRLLDSAAPPAPALPDRLRAAAPTVHWTGGSSDGLSILEPLSTTCAGAHEHLARPQADGRASLCRIVVPGAGIPRSRTSRFRARSSSAPCSRSRSLGRGAPGRISSCRITPPARAVHLQARGSGRAPRARRGSPTATRPLTSLRSPPIRGAGCSGSRDQRARQASGPDVAPKLAWRSERAA
jgi:hypothetical protein